MKSQVAQSLELEQEIFEEESCPRITIVGGTNLNEGETFSILTFGKAFKASKTSILLSRLPSLFPRKNAVAYCSKQQCLSFPIRAGIVNTPLLVKRDIKENLFRMSCVCGERCSTFVHVGGIQIFVFAYFRSGIDSPMKLALRENKRNGSRGVTLGLIQGNLHLQRLVFTMYPKYVVPLEDCDVDGTLSLAHEFIRHDLMIEGSIPYSIEYKVVYALANSPRRDLFRENEFFEI